MTRSEPQSARVVTPAGVVGEPAGGLDVRPAAGDADRRPAVDAGQPVWDLQAGTPTTTEPAGSLARRIIACLDVRAGQVVKGTRFEDLRHAGDPVELATRYGIEGIDEVVFLDITATLESRRAILDVIDRAASALFIPLTVGGGIRSLDDAAAMMAAGADKVAINSAALASPGLIDTIAGRFGNQAVVVAIDAARAGSRYLVRTRAGTTDTGLEAAAWAREAAGRGAGEILLTSIDRDGTRTGFECELTALVADAVSIPVIASGGAGEFEHFAEVFGRGRADAALAASIFHFRLSEVADLKSYLARRGIPVRPVPPAVTGAAVLDSPGAGVERC